MASLLDLPPEEQKEKIKLIIMQAINKNNEQIDSLQKENSSLKSQEEADKYYMALSGDPKLSLSYVGGSIINLLSVILSGFAEVSKQFQMELEKRPQTGGAIEDEESQEQKIQKEANNLNALIGEAERQLKKYQEVSSKSLGPGTIKSEFNRGLDKAKNMGIAILKTGVKWSEEFVNEMLDLSMEASGEGKLLDTPLDELSPELNKKLILLAGVLKELSTNPATKEAIREIAKAAGVSMIEIMEEIKPQLNKVTDEGIQMFEQVAEKSVRGATATGVSVSQAFLAEIPWVGGLLDLFLAIGKGFNSAMNVASTFSEKGGQLAEQNAKMVKGTEDKVNAGIERIKTAVEQAKNTLKEAQQKTNPSSTKAPSTNPPSTTAPTTASTKAPTTASTTASTKAPTTASTKAPTTSDIKQNTQKDNTGQNTQKDNTGQNGGSTRDYIPNRKIRNKIQKAGNRLRKTLKLFNKTLPKMNYSLKQNNKRKAKTSQKNKKKYTRKHIE